MKTAMQEWFDELKANYPYMANDIYQKGFQKYIEKEKEQIQKAFSDGQEIPINHPALPHYSNEEYFNNNYNQNK